MKSIVGEKDRKIIPRWRGFRSSLGDFQIEQPKLVDPVSSSLQSNIGDWHRESSLWTALDAVAGAIVEGRLDLVTDALSRVRSDPQTPPAALAILSEHDRNDFFAESMDSPVVDRCREQIRASRIRLAEYPYDAIEWIDLARSFTTLGSLEKARRSVAAALALAPADVFVLRAASRFYIQQGDPDRAQWILSRAPRTLRNPWLLASEVAAASVAGRESQLLKIAERMERADFRDQDLTELRAALGTVDIDAGRHSKGKKLLRRSLHGANENALAQIQWMDHTRLGNVIDTSAAKPPNRFEAAAWNAFFEGNWERSIDKSKLWVQDQPFSVDAGILSSYVLADVLCRPEDALHILDISLRANPDDITLLNNFAYANIQMGRADVAAKVLGSIQRTSDSLEGATIEATFGLLAFRRGEFEQGRILYENAIKIFQHCSAPESVARAAVYLAIEEVRARTPNSTVAVKRALELTKDNKRADMKAKLDELENHVKAWLSEERVAPPL